MNLLFTYLDRALRSSGFLIAICICFFGLLLFSFDFLVIDFELDALSKFGFAFEDNNMRWILATAASIPFSMSYADDLHSKSFIYQIVRSDRKSYEVSEFLATCISGGLAIVIGCGAFFILTVIQSSEIYSLDTGRRAALLGAIPFIELLHEGNLGGYLTCFWISQFVFGAFWAAIGLVVSSFLPYSYIAVASPLIVAIFFTQLGNLFGLPYFINPVIFFTTGTFSTPFFTFIAVIGVYAIYTACLMLIFHLRLKRVYKNA